VNDDDISTTTSFELVIIFSHHFSQPLCIVISLFYWLMTSEWPHLLISCSEEKYQRQKSDNASASIPAAVLRVRRCVAHGLCRSRFHSTRQKVRHHVTWCLTKTKT